MNNIIDDFINSSKTLNGFGLLDGNYLASDLARTLSKNQIRDYTRRSTIPLAFIIFAQELLELRYSELFKKMSDITFSAVCEALYNTSDSKHSSDADYIRKNLLTKRHTELKRNFGSQEHIWQEVERIQPESKDIPFRRTTSRRKKTVVSRRPEIHSQVLEKRFFESSKKYEKVTKL